jgi:hypothetical protein
MKKVRILLVLLISLFIFDSCQKDNPVPSSSQPKVAKTMDAMVVKSTFDWKTAIQYKFTLTSKSNNAVTFVTPSGSVNRKYFLIANSPFTVTVSIPAYEKTIHLLFNAKDIELPLSGSTLSYTFNY